MYCGSQIDVCQRIYEAHTLREFALRSQHPLSDIIAREEEDCRWNNRELNLQYILYINNNNRFY